jgi:predicted deacylase
MSGGPKVTGVNVASYGLARSKTISIGFDQPLSKTQDVTKFVSIKGINATVTKGTNQILVSYSNAPACTDFSFSVAAGIENQYGVVQTASWQQDLRTVCQTVSTIGYSLGGRPIQAYTFGSGSKTILYTGAIHGNELSSRALMLAWINELELNVRSIPAGTKIVVIPAINTDGVVVNVRNNAANVDLNRNFPTSNWQTDIVSPTNQPIPGGGGVTALSEPESQALATFTIALQPRLVMSYHSQAGYAMGNLAGDSATLAATYAKLSGYKNTTGSTSAFGYAITGSYDDWLAEIQGITSVLIELTTNTNAEFSRNKPAMWAMARS